MKYELDKAINEWDDSMADKEAIVKILQKADDCYRPTGLEINEIETEIN